LSGTNYVNIFVHPDAFLRRWEIVPDGKRAKCPILDELRIQKSGAQIRKATGITILPSKESLQIMHSNKFPLRNYIRFQSTQANIKIKNILDGFICSKNYRTLFLIKLCTGIMNHSILLLTDSQLNFSF
jgi:hypothetical protein